MPIDRDEFQNWMQLIRQDLQGVNDRLDVLNGRTRQAETKIAILEDRGVQAHDRTARFWTALVGLGGVALEIGHRLLGLK